MRRLALPVSLALTGCAFTAPATVTHHVSPQQAVRGLYYRRTTVETCDGRTLGGYAFAARGDSLRLRPNPRVDAGPTLAWSHLRSLTATRGRAPDPTASVVAWGAAATAVATGLAAVVSPACGPGCDFDSRSLNVLVTLSVGSLVTLVGAVATARQAPRQELRYAFRCPGSAPPSGAGAEPRAGRPGGRTW